MFCYRSQVRQRMCRLYYHRRSRCIREVHRISDRKRSPYRRVCNRHYTNHSWLRLLQPLLLYRHCRMFFHHSRRPVKGIQDRNLVQRYIFHRHHRSHRVWRSRLQRHNHYSLYIQLEDCCIPALREESHRKPPHSSLVCTARTCRRWHSPTDSLG